MQTPDEVPFDEGEIRAAERALEIALASPDPTAWVFAYTEGHGNLATVWSEGSWVSGPPESGATTNMRGVILWRKEADGRWRVALEHMS